MEIILYYRNLRETASKEGKAWHYYNACLAKATRDWRKTNSFKLVPKQ
jgi:hypothetical protein